MNPDAIAILTGGTVSYRDPITATEHFRSTTEHDSDAGGILWGNIRVEAGALLAKRYPNASVVVCGGGRAGPPSHAVVAQAELQAYGVAQAKIILEEQSTNTHEQLTELCALAKTHSIRSIVLVSNGYHIPRIEAFLDRMEVPELLIECVSAESIVAEQDQTRREGIQDVYTSASYLRRIEQEAQGIEAILAGTYEPRSGVQKREG